MLNMDTIKELEEQAALRGVSVIDCGDGHYQIHGPLLVNYYPTSRRRSAYVAGTTIGHVGVSPKRAVEMAFVPPNLHGSQRIDKRKGNYRKTRHKMLEKKDICHWCGLKLTLDTSTLDHVIPLACGGLDNANNRVLACEPCNNKRGHSMPELRT